VNLPFNADFLPYATFAARRCIIGNLRLTSDGCRSSRKRGRWMNVHISCTCMPVMQATIDVMLITALQR